MGDDGQTQMSTYDRCLLLGLIYNNTVSVVDFATVIILFIYDVLTGGAAQILHAQFKNVAKM